MKSRLLPPPLIDGNESDAATPASIRNRRASDFDEAKPETAAVESTRAAQAVTEPVTPAARSAPQVSPRPTGRYAVVVILLVCVATIGSLVWSAFLRDEAFGVVSGRITEISPPWPGTLTAVYAQVGDVIRQGEVLAVVDDPELLATIERLSDEIRAAQAELDSKVALLSIAARQRTGHTEEIRANYYDLRGELLAEQSRYDELNSKLQRRSLLAKRQAISAEEIESLEYEVHGLAAKIENLALAVETLEPTQDALADDASEADQLKPSLTKIENLQAEFRRLRVKLRRGTIRAPMGGTIIDVAAHVSERVTPQQRLLELLPEGSLELVLYVKQADAGDYRIDQHLEVIVEPSDAPVRCRVVRIGQRFEKPKSHVPGRYRLDEKLLPIHLKPDPDANLSDEVDLRIGSVVRLPVRWFGSSR